MIFLLEDDYDKYKWFKEQWPELLYATNVTDAVELLQDNDDIDVIFLDYDLSMAYSIMRGSPGTGLELAEEMVKLGLHTNTRIVIHSSSYSGAESIAKALASTHNNVTIQPYNYLQVVVQEGNFT